jgi:hypothetical protein
MNNTEAANTIIDINNMIDHVKALSSYYDNGDIPIMSAFLKDFKSLMNEAYPVVIRTERSNLDKVDQIIGESLRRVTIDLNLKIDDLYLKISENNSHCLIVDYDIFAQILDYYLDIESKKENRDKYIDHVLNQSNYD